VWVGEHFEALQPTDDAGTATLSKRKKWPEYPQLAAAPPHIRPVRHSILSATACMISYLNCKSSGSAEVGDNRLQRLSCAASRAAQCSTVEAVEEGFVGIPLSDHRCRKRVQRATQTRSV
jgi:hypothetical protein